MYNNKPQAMQAFLYFLMKHKGKDAHLFSSYFYESREITPQEYYFNEFGTETLRTWFTDWAAHTAADVDYITRDEYQSSIEHYQYLTNDLYKDQCIPTTLCAVNAYVWEGTDSGTNGWIRPQAAFTTRGWSYNVFKINNSKKTIYRYLNATDRPFFCF